MSTTSRPRQQQSPSKSPRPSRTRTRRAVVATIIAALVIGVLFAIYSRGSGKDGPGGTTSPQAYDVGSPGVGKSAPGFSLPSTSGAAVSLADYRGKNVLLYFQEGLMCQPCWQQITDLERTPGAVRAVGVDAVLSITTDPVDLLAQKVQDEGITSTPVLSDPDLAVSRRYATNQYGMMGDSRNGHSFVLVGPDGEIRWRADYGGPPDYTMYVPVKRLLADLRSGTAKG